MRPKPTVISQDILEQGGALGGWTEFVMCPPEMEACVQPYLQKLVAERIDEDVSRSISLLNLSVTQDHANEITQTTTSCVTGVQLIPQSPKHDR